MNLVPLLRRLTVQTGGVESTSTARAFSRSNQVLAWFLPAAAAVASDTRPSKV